MRAGHVLVGAAVVALVVAGALVGATSTEDEAPAGALWVCGCGDECNCGTVKTGPGTCGCGNELVGTHVLALEGDTAVVCTCGPDCSCTLDGDDGTRCGCGKPVRRVDLEGQGLYRCGCGETCTCNTISDEPGTCACGKPLVKIE